MTKTFSASTTSVNALLDNEENPTEAAKAIGMSRATIYRKIRQYGIS